MNKKKINKAISQGRVAENRRAKFDYSIIDTVEAGIVLLGSEVKSLRLGRASINESYATNEYGQIVLVNSNIPEYNLAASGQNHDPKRVRRLLVHKKERDKILGQIKKDGCTVVPLSLYFNNKGLAKISLGIAEGKKKVDKRKSQTKIKTKTKTKSLTKRSQPFQRRRPLLMMSSPSHASRLSHFVMIRARGVRAESKQSRSTVSAS